MMRSVVVLDSFGTLIDRYRRIDLSGPGVNTTLQIMHVGEPLPLQKCDDLQTSHPVMANYDRGLRPVQFFGERGNLLHGYIFAARDLRQLPFPGLTHIEQMWPRWGWFGQRGF